MTARPSHARTCRRRAQPLLLVAATLVLFVGCGKSPPGTAPAGEANVAAAKDDAKPPKSDATATGKQGAPPEQTRPESKLFGTWRTEGSTAGIKYIVSVEFRPDLTYAARWRDGEGKPFSYIPDEEGSWKVSHATQYKQVLHVHADATPTELKGWVVNFGGDDWITIRHFEGVPDEVFWKRVGK